MKVSPKGMAIVYFVMGMLFTFIAAQTAGDTVWNVTTIILAVIASLQFGGSIRLMAFDFKLKHDNRKK